MVFRRQCIARQDRNAQPGRHHVADSLQRIGAGNRCVAAIELRATFEYLVTKAVTDVEQDRVLTGQFRRVDRLALGPGMTLRDNDLEWFLVEEFGGDARRLEGQRDDRCVDAAGLESSLELLGDVFLDFQRHFRCQRVERRNKIGQQIRRYRVDRAEPE